MAAVVDGPADESELAPLCQQCHDCHCPNFDWLAGVWDSNVLLVGRPLGSIVTMDQVRERFTEMAEGNPALQMAAAPEPIANRWFIIDLPVFAAYIQSQASVHW